MHNICINCWHKEQYCKCTNKRLEPIDNNMIYIITHLNKKGLKTKFCCGGHIEKQFIYIYISFIDEYKFNELPEDYKYKNAILYYKNTKIKHNQEMQKDINKLIKILKTWVKNKPSN
jgi:hypothetical protein